MDNEGGGRRRFIWWLFEPLCGVGMIPVLVIAFNREINVKTKKYISYMTIFQKITIAHSSP